MNFVEATDFGPANRIFTSLKLTSTLTKKSYVNTVKHRTTWGGAGCGSPIV